jgi:signal transduction histidine kinase/ligand-binding sensor domain-containing protein
MKIAEFKILFCAERFALTLMTLLFFVCSCHSQTHIFRKFNVADGLPSSLLYRSFQDSRGFIWFGSDAGVTRFDGSRFDLFTMDDGLSDNEVFGIHEDKKGNIWFRTFNGKLCFFDGKSIHNEHTDPWLDLPDNGQSLHSFYADRNGDIWIGNFSGQIIHISGNHISFLDDYKNKSIPHITEDSNGRLILLSGKNRAVYNPILKKFEDLPASHEMSSDMFFNVEESLSYFFSSDKIICLENGVEKVLVTDFTPFQVNNITRGPDGKIYCCSRDLGLVVLDPKNGNRTYLVNDVTLNYVMFDRENNLWLCTRENGVWMIPNGLLDVEIYNTSNGLTKSSVFDIFIDSQKRVWLGSYDNMVYYLDNQSLQSIVVPHEKEQKGKIHSILETSSHKLFFAGDGGLFQLNNSSMSLTPIPYNSVRKGNRVSGAAKILGIDKNEVVWAGKPLGLYKCDTRQSTPVAFLDTTLIGKRRTIVPFFDEHSNTWCSTSEGLILIPANLSDDSLKKNLLNARVKNIQETTDNTIVLATDGIGVVLSFNHEISDTVNLEDGIQSNMINDIFTLGNEVWYASNKGLGKFKVDRGKFMDLTTYSTSDGLISENVKSIAIDNNKIYAGTDRGLCIIPLHASIQTDYTPNLYIREVSGTWGKWSGLANISTDYTNNNLSVTFGAITFTQPEKVEYEYNLNNGEKWLACPGNYLALSQLPYQSNQLQIRARNKNSNWVYSDILSFDVSPPFWKTTAFYLIAIFLIGSLISLLLYSRYQKKVQLLEKTALINEERNRISADLHDDIGADLSRIVVASELIKYNHSQEKDLPAVNKIIDGARNLRSKVDNIIWALNPSYDSMKNFVSYIRQQGVEFFSDTPIHFNLKHDESGLDKHLSTLQRRNLFLVIKEIFNNALKHSEATEVTVHISNQKGALMICVEDNGKGMPSQSEIKWNNGGQTLRKRTLEINGTIKWEETTGGGTTVCIYVKTEVE